MTARERACEESIKQTGKTVLRFSTQIFSAYFCLLFTYFLFTFICLFAALASQQLRSADERILRAEQTEVCWWCDDPDCQERYF